jgi:peptidoglycan/LPS O-acetylase OafA/YrhL
VKEADVSGALAAALFAAAIGFILILIGGGRDSTLRYRTMRGAFWAFIVGTATFAGTVVASWPSQAQQVVIGLLLASTAAAVGWAWYASRRGSR